MSNKTHPKTGQLIQEQIHQVFSEAVERFQSGDYRAAAEGFQRVLEQYPDSVTCLHNLGLVYHLLGQHEKALPFLRKAVKRNPDYIDAQFNLGNALAGSGSLEKARQQFEKVIAMQPDHAMAHNNLANLLDGMGDHGRADRLYRKAIALDAHYAEAWRNLGVFLLRRESLADAVSTLQHYLTLQPNDLAMHLELARGYARQRQFQKAEQVLERVMDMDSHSEDAKFEFAKVKFLGSDRLRALQILQDTDLKESTNPLVWNLKGLVFESLGLVGDSEQAYTKALTLNDQVAGIYSNLGNCLALQHRYGASRDAFEKALELEPEFIEARNNLGNLLFALGDIREARHQFDLSLRQNPDRLETYRHRSRLKKYSESDREEIAALERRLAQVAETDSALHLHFALAKAFDDCGLFDQALLHYRKGNELKARVTPFDSAAFASRMDHLAAVFNDGFFSQAISSGQEDSSPVFIVGMPRSGTTLVEQIIGAHPEGYGAGELVAMNEVIYRLETENIFGITYPEVVARLDSGFLQKMADCYVRASRGELPPEITAVADKMPFNFMHLGLIAVLFPKARVVHCRRHPLDVCLSIYFQFFPPGVDFAYREEDIANYYVAYHRLMAHWQASLPLAVHAIGYEDLIHDQEQVTRELLTYLRLPWDDRCLRFQQSKNPVRTLSAWQVRQPLYRNSIQRWKNYRQLVEPIAEVLVANGVLTDGWERGPEQ